MRLFPFSAYPHDPRGAHRRAYDVCGDTGIPGGGGGGRGLRRGGMIVVAAGVGLEEYVVALLRHGEGGAVVRGQHTGGGKAECRGVQFAVAEALRYIRGAGLGRRVEGRRGEPRLPGVHQHGGHYRQGRGAQRGQDGQGLFVHRSVSCSGSLGTAAPGHIIKEIKHPFSYAQFSFVLL